MHRDIAGSIQFQAEQIEKQIEIPGARAEHRNNPIRDLADLKCQTSPSSLHILGISTTNTNPELPRVSELSERM